MSDSVMICLPEGKRSLNSTIQLTGSKSESNRALIMQALSAGKVRVENLSQATDTVTLSQILKGWKVEGGKVEGEKVEGGKGDQHRSNHLVRIAPDVFRAMKALAEENDRPLTREIRQALIAWLEDQGRWPPPDDDVAKKGGKRKRGDA